MHVTEEMIDCGLVKSCGHKNTRLYQTWTPQKSEDNVTICEPNYQCLFCCEKWGLNPLDENFINRPLLFCDYPQYVDIGKPPIVYEFKCGHATLDGIDINGKRILLKDINLPQKPSRFYFLKKIIASILYRIKHSL